MYECFFYIITIKMLAKLMVNFNDNNKFCKIFQTLVIFLSLISIEKLEYAICCRDLKQKFSSTKLTNRKCSKEVKKIYVSRKTHLLNFIQTIQITELAVKIL